MKWRTVVFSCFCVWFLIPSSTASAAVDSLHVDSVTLRPPSVNGERFMALSSDVAWRWDIAVNGESEYEAGYLNGEQTLGFSDTVEVRLARRNVRLEPARLSL